MKVGGELMGFSVNPRLQCVWGAEPGLLGTRGVGRVCVGLGVTAHLKPCRDTQDFPGRGTDRLTVFGENKPRAPRQWGNMVPSDTPDQQPAETVPRAWGLPGKMHLSFKRERRLVSAVGAAGSSARK